MTLVEVVLPEERVGATTVKLTGDKVAEAEADAIGKWRDWVNNSGGFGKLIEI